MISSYAALALSTAFLCWFTVSWVRSWFEGPAVPSAPVARAAEPERASTPLGPGDMLATLFFLPVLAASIAWFCVIAALFLSPLVLIWMAFQ